MDGFEKVYVTGNGHLEGVKEWLNEQQEYITVENFDNADVLFVQGDSLGGSDQSLILDAVQKGKRLWFGLESARVRYSSLVLQGMVANGRGHHES